jgi:hypothetical protein
MKKLLILLIFILSFSVLAKVDSAFSITHNLSRTIVKTPARRTDDLSIVIINNTLSNVYAKITTDTKNIKFFRLNSKSQKVIDISVKKGTKYYYVPLAPSIYPVEIAFGKVQYEIPGKK